MTQIEWLRKQRQRIQEVSDKLAHNTMSSALTQDQYLQNVGAYRAYRTIIRNFTDLIDKVQGGGSEPVEGGLSGMDAVNDDDDEDYTPPVMQGKARRGKFQQSKPRGWGGP